MRQLDALDRVGLGWRKPLAASILLNTDKIDVVEVIIDDYFKASRSELRALQTLAAQVSVVYHGVSLGLASAFPVDEHRLNQLARVLDILQPDYWSEHLAFVRAGGIEIGHLAAPPRTNETVYGALKNLQRIERVVGELPVMENIATLIDPPSSVYPEPHWVSSILATSGAGLLLDLNNLYANALNFGHDPEEYMMQFLLDRVRMVHLSGGKWIAEPGEYARSPHGERLLDDHLHDVPERVYELLRLVGEQVAWPLTVIIERDGAYPNFDVMLDQVSRARLALQAGRRLQAKRKAEKVECARI